MNTWKLYRRTWRPSDGTKFAYLFVYRRDWWILRLGWLQIEYFKPVDQP
jgi:hypothetical protein